MYGLTIEQADVHQGVAINQKPKYQYLEGQVVFSNNINYKTMDKAQNQRQIYKNKEKNIDQPLISSSGFCKIGNGMAAMQVILLTVKNFGQVPIRSINKLKVYQKCQIQNHNTLKIQQSQDNYKIYCFPIKECYHFAYACLWAKLLSMNIQVDMQEDFVNCCEGEVFKKSNVLKNWQPRYLLITQKDGLISYKNKQGEPSIHIEQIKQLWTRFQLIENNKFLVIKFWHSLVKYQFGIPLHRAVKWFKAFYSLLNK